MTQLKNMSTQNQPVWFDGKTINESLFCQEFLRDHPMVYTEHAFFTPDGKLTDLEILRQEIYQALKGYVSTGLSHKVDNIVSALKIEVYVDDLPPQPDRIHVLNGTLLLDGTFIEEKKEIVRCRFPVRYNPDAKPPERWHRFLPELFWPEDIPTVQEFIGYSLIASNAGQRMLIVKGSGGEGKSQLGNVLFCLFGQNAKNGSIGKIAENRFALADLEHVHLMIDDDMRMDALRDASRVKTVVTCKGKMDMERKGVQSHQGWMYTRILAFSNGDLKSLYDKSDGFYRRQMILTTRPKPRNRLDDPYLSDKLCEEAEGIFLWAFAGLQRLVSNNFRFSESERARNNNMEVKREANNADSFMESKNYIRYGKACSITSTKLYDRYRAWCVENDESPMERRDLIRYLKANQARFGIGHTNNIIDDTGRRAWGFSGIAPLDQAV